MWNLRAAIATGLWLAAGILTFVFILSGGWLLLPFALAGGGGTVLYLFLTIVGLALAAYLIGRRGPARASQPVRASVSGLGSEPPGASKSD